MKLVSIAFLLFFALYFYACSNKENTTATSELNEVTEWVYMDSFHTIMSEAFHPYHDSANLEPARLVAEEMAQRASSWASALLPNRVDNNEMKNQLIQLKVDTRRLAEMIKAGLSDDEVGASLTALHESFHGIMEAWNSNEIHEHQH